LDETLRTGKPVFDAMYGQPFFEFVREHADAASVFDGAMTSVAGLHAAAVCDAYDFSNVACVVDVGGGRGIQLTELLAKHRHLRGVLYDFPHVVEIPNPDLVSTDMQERCERVGGDFFESVPAGGDVYLLSHILHDWDDRRALSILRACRSAMAPSAKLLIVECVIENGTNRWSQGHLTDLQMSLTLSGKERTAAEFAQLLTEAGFSLSRILPLAAAESIVEALPLAG
ncbi:MAG: methyltransferase, partial [Candidatus Eremiobacteraeota bacterium]|nr:methyltransferase [Candidatus Eremiobacteraeota bacterium]